MDPKDALLVKYALETLDTVAAGLPPRVLFDQVERLAATRIDELKRDTLEKLMRDREWAYDYTDRLTGNRCLAIRQAGVLAAAAL